MIHQDHFNNAFSIGMESTPQLLSLSSRGTQAIDLNLFNY